MERPKEWEQERDRIICEYIAGSDPEDPDLGDIFEAGADAMHKADVQWIEERNLSSHGAIIFITQQDWDAFKEAKE